MKTLNDMIEVNKRQAAFYNAIALEEEKNQGEGYAENQAANVATRLWAKIRYRQQHAAGQAGMAERERRAHLDWAARKRGGDFLEIGCFAGGSLTFDLIDLSGTYLGVDLSARAVARLQQRIAAAGLGDKAKAVALDLLAVDEARSFDLVYAHGVLHHFANPGILFSKIAAITRPQGALIFSEPSAVNPVYRAIRAGYRPFQSDALWEWPFTRKTVRALEAWFEPVDGFGWGRWSLALGVLAGLPMMGRALFRLHAKILARETGARWHERVWHNSTVTALYARR